MGGGGGGIGIRLCGKHLQELYTVYLTCFTTPDKNLGGEGASQINTCRQVSLQVNFQEKPTFSIGVY